MPISAKMPFAFIKQPNFFIKKCLISINRYRFQYLAYTNKRLIYLVGMKLEKKKNGAFLGDKNYVSTKNHRKRF